MSNSDKRKNPTHNEETLFFSEVKGVCPLCGRYLMSKGSRNYVKNYEIAHIYPCNPTADDLNILDGVQPPPDTEAYENKIALCLGCHNDYDKDKTLSKYIDLRKIKDKILESNSIKKIMSDYPLEDNIREIIANLLCVDDKTLSDVSLRRDALHVDEKIEDSYSLLRQKIKTNIISYFQVVEECFKQLDSGTYENVSIQIKSFYRKCSSLSNDKKKIFEEIVNWIQSKSRNRDIIACEIIASFFVQKCEVFDEITK